MDIKKLFNLIFSHKLIVTNEVTNGLPDGVLWDNNTFYIEKENGKYVVYKEGHFDLTRKTTLGEAVRWARNKTATLEEGENV